MLHTMCALQHVTCLFHKVMTMMYSTPFFKHHVPCPLHLLHCTFYYVLWAMAWPQGPDLVGPNNNSKLGYELHWPQGPYLVGPTNNIKSGYEQHWPQGLYLERPTNNSKSGYEQHWRSIRRIDPDQCHPHSFKLFFIRVCGWLRMYYNAGRLCHQCSKE